MEHLLPQERIWRPNELVKSFPPLLLALASILPLSGCDRDNAPPQEYQPRPNFLAAGNPVAGRQVFVELECVTCHRVAGDDFDPNPPTDAAPSLGTLQAEQSPEDVAGFILLPSHTIATETGPWQGNKKSAMADYSGMTVRQLVDVIAYIRAPARGKLSSTRNPNP
jgi:hypothetical protein